MGGRIPAGSYRFERWLNLGPSSSTAVMAAVAALPILMVAAFVPVPFILPVICSAAFAAAVLLVLYAWMSGSPHHGGRVTAWDLAGALALIACAAGMFSQPDAVVQLIRLVTATA
jgi:hypothetical protein